MKKEICPHFKGAYVNLVVLNIEGAGFFNIELGPYKNVLNNEVSSIQECFGPYKSVLIIEVSSFKGLHSI